LNVVQEAVGKRERNRLERHRSFLRTAKAVVATEGLEALTMQRLAAELDCAVGTAYTYFPSKSALVAELQRDAIETLTESYLLFRARFDASVASSETSGPVVALAHLVGFGRFWVATFDTFPEEARLLQLLMSEPGKSVISDDDVGRVLPSATRLLDHARTAFKQAAALGALTAADPMERAIVLAAALNGMLLLDRLARIDPALFDGARLAGSTTDDLLRSWGADPAALAAAGDRIAALAQTGPLAPPLPVTSED
jgi:AcrR family transcriptional regulator